MSKATIVSGAPFRVVETHPHCIPYEIVLPAADFMNNGLTVTTINDGSHSLYIDEKRGNAEIPDEGMALAERTVNDILISQLLYDPRAHPAIFWVPGELTEKQVRTMHADKVAEAFGKQRLWFETLIRRADAAYNKNHNMAEISDLHRVAAQFLGLQREWCDKDPGSMVNCPACFTVVRKQAAICYACKAIVNDEAYEKIRFAGQVTAAPTPTQP